MYVFGMEKAQFNIYNWVCSFYVCTKIKVHWFENKMVLPKAVDLCKKFTIY